MGPIIAVLVVAAVGAALFVVRLRRRAFARHTDVGAHSDGSGSSGADLESQQCEAAVAARESSLRDKFGPSYSGGSLGGGSSGGGGQRSTLDEQLLRGSQEHFRGQQQQQQRAAPGASLASHTPGPADSHPRQSASSGSSSAAQAGPSAMDLVAESIQAVAAASMAVHPGGGTPSLTRSVSQPLRGADSVGGGGGDGGHFAGVMMRVRSGAMVCGGMCRLKCLAQHQITSPHSFLPCAPQSYTVSPMDPQARLFYNPAYSSAAAAVAEESSVRGAVSAGGANSVAAVGCDWAME